jgi:hypothetical protein
MSETLGQLVMGLQMMGLQSKPQLYMPEIIQMLLVLVQLQEIKKYCLLPSWCLPNKTDTDLLYFY